MGEEKRRVRMASRRDVRWSEELRCGTDAPAQAAS